MPFCRGRCTPRVLVPLRSTAPTSSRSIYGIFPKEYSVPPGTGHFWPQSQKCPKGSLETKVSRLPCALCLIRICDLVPHVRRGRFLSQRIKGLSHAAAPLPLMLCHGRSVCIYRKGGQSRPPLRNGYKGCAHLSHGRTGQSPAPTDVLMECL